MRKNARKYVELNCEKCGKSFNRLTKEHTRNTKRGRKTFCGISCATTYSNMISPRQFERNISGLKKYWTEKINDGLSVFRYIIGHVKKRSKEKGIKYDVNAEYLNNIFNLQNGICPYTGIKMSLTSGIKDKVIPTSASLDKIDPNEGYIKGNVEFVCYSINMAKNDFSKDIIIDFVNRLKKVDLSDQIEYII